MSMTVGIYLTNGKEAVVLSDVRAGFGQRTSDTFNKMDFFSSDKYHGAIYATGSGKQAEDLFTKLRQMSSSECSFHTFMRALSNNLDSSIQNYEDFYIDKVKKEITRRADVISDPNYKANMINSDERKLLDNLEELRKMEHTQFVGIAYDKDSDGIKACTFYPKYFTESNSQHYEIGSGSDGAGLYFAKSLPGRNLSEQSVAEMLYFVANAYSFSTLNVGVGGTPKIVIIDKNKSNLLDTTKIRQIVNLSGAHLTNGYSRLTLTKSVDTIEGILSDDKESLKGFASIVGYDEKILSEIYIPASSWTEAVNSRIF